LRGPGRPVSFVEFLNPDMHQRLAELTGHLARESGHAAEREAGSVPGTLNRLGVSDRGRRLVAPETVAPAENPDRDTVVGRLAASRAALLAAIESGDGLALGSIRHTHARFGELDLYEWILFVAEHEGRHAAQIAEAASRLVPTS
jgi:hypothetical protein